VVSVGFSEVLIIVLICGLWIVPIAFVIGLSLVRGRRAQGDDE
jgi:hypothetical protein